MQSSIVTSIQTSSQTQYYMYKACVQCNEDTTPQGKLFQT